MKKFLFLLPIAMLLFASCEGPIGPVGPMGEKGEPGEDYWFIKVYTIKSDEWELVMGEDELGSYYMAEVEIPELDEDIYEDGTVFCYMFQNIDGLEVQTPLPFTIPYGETNQNGEELLWTETYAFDFTEGSIGFYVNYSHFYTSNRPPDISYRVVLNY